MAKFLRATSAFFLAVAITAQAPAAVVFSDDFNDGVQTGWGNERGNWRETGGTYDATNPENIPPTYSSVTALSPLTDFTVEVDVLGLDDGGVWLRSDFNGGLISGVLLVTGGFLGTNNGLYWHVVSNGGFSGFLNIGPAAGIQGTNQSLRIEVSGDLYRAYLNNVLITTLDTSSMANAPTSGDVGLYDYSPTSEATDPRGQTFDNLRISVPDEVPEPGTTALLGAAVLVLIGARRRRLG